MELMKLFLIPSIKEGFLDILIHYVISWLLSPRAVIFHASHAFT